MRQQLSLGVFELAPDGGPRALFVSNLEIGTDFGPTETAMASIHDSRRAQLNVRYAYLRAERIARWFDLTAGRQILIDVLGYDALDGLTVGFAGVPFLRLEANGGLAARRGWSGFGPDIYDPDGTTLGDDMGYVLGVSLSTRNLGWLDARSAYRKIFDDAVTREEAGLAIEVRPWEGAAVHASGWHDAIYGQLGSLRAGAAADICESTRVGMEWRRERPIFSADSIWNAFGPEPYDDLAVDARYQRGLWRASADGSVRTFDAGETRPTRPGLIIEASRASDPTDPTDPINPSDAVRRAIGGGARLVRLIDETFDGAHIGAEGRVSTGYGGHRSYGDLFARLPIRPASAWYPLWIRMRLGGVYIDEAPSHRSYGHLHGVSGWGLAALRWQASESAVVEILVEEHVSRYTPSRVRAMGRIALENWL